jgi:hypothetical protein
MQLGLQWQEAYPGRPGSRLLSSNRQNCDSIGQSESLTECRVVSDDQATRKWDDTAEKPCMLT